MGKAQGQLFTGASMATGAIFPDSLIREKQRVIIVPAPGVLRNPILIRKGPSPSCVTTMPGDGNTENDTVFRVNAGNNTSATENLQPCILSPTQAGMVACCEIYVKLYRD